jgi:hypothetical protein
MHALRLVQHAPLANRSRCLEIHPPNGIGKKTSLEKWSIPQQFPLQPPSKVLTEFDQPGDNRVAEIPPADEAVAT